MKVHHFERLTGCQQRIIDPFLKWEELGEFPLVILPDGGLRTDEAKQRELYQLGKSMAKTLKETSHGRGMAGDVGFAKVIKNIVVGIYTEELDGDEYLRRADIFVDFMRKLGLVIGDDWKKQFSSKRILVNGVWRMSRGGDTPHVNLPGWQSLPFPPVTVPPYIKAKEA